MKTGRKSLLVGASFLAVCCGLPAWGIGFDKSQYDVIVAMKPFGEKAKSAGVLASERALEQPKVRFSEVLKVTLIRHDDILGDACAIDDTKNPAWHAYLGVGESKDGIQIRKIDLDTNGVLLGKEGQDDEWLYLSGTGTPLTSPRSRSSSGGAFSRGATLSTPIIASQPVLQVAPPASPLAAPPGLSREDVEKDLEAYQMDLIRSGGMDGPPLPMELTPEMDAQLVSEGVLPPM